MMRDAGVDRFLARASSVANAFYQEFPPATDLTEFVACKWVRIVRCDGVLNDAILPDGCADIMVYDDQPPRVAGPDAVMRRTTLWDGLVIAGIRLRPGAYRAAFGCAAAQMVNREGLLSDISGDGHRLHGLLLAAGNLTRRLTLLEDWVRTAVSAATSKDRTIIAACRMLAGIPSIDIDTVAQHVNWNVRMLHRQITYACGYSPKHFQRIMRIQQTLRLANIRAPGLLADLAMAAGYADQSHMSRDFKEITGFKPSRYFADKPISGLSQWLEGW